MKKWKKKYNLRKARMNWSWKTAWKKTESMKERINEKEDSAEKEREKKERKSFLFLNSSIWNKNGEKTKYEKRKTQKKIFF